MGADFIIHHSCHPKQTLGDGDEYAGTAEMVRLLKMGTMIRFFEERARKEGKDPEQMSVVRQERNATTGKVVERSVHYRELRQEHERLTVLAPSCAQCPVNVLDDSFGCYGFLRYPIPAKSEQWLMNQFQPADTPGGFLCLKAVVDLGYNGKPMQDWRESKTSQIFELPQPIRRALDPNRPQETTITSNQIWHPLLGLGSELQPFHCLYVPTWLGIVRLDGEVPSQPEHLSQLARLTTFEERQERTTFDPGPTDQGPDIFAVQRLLFACYTAWLHNVPLLVDA